MTIAELTTLLEEKLGTSVPVFFHHVFVDDGDEIPASYLVTDSTGINPFRADNQNYYVSYINTATLYSVNYDEQLLAKIDEVLTNEGVPYDRETDYDSDLQLYNTVYTLELEG